MVNLQLLPKTFLKSLLEKKICIIIYCLGIIGIVTLKKR